MSPAATAPRRMVIVPRALPPTALRGAGSGLAVRTLQGATMGTIWRVRCPIPGTVSAGEIRGALEASFARVVAQMSHWEPGSDLCRFNRAPAGSWHELPPEFFHVLSRALHVASLADGTYDPTIGRLIDLHGFGAEPPAGDPVGEEWETARQGADWRRLRLDPVGRRAFQPGGCQLNLSSIAKGYAVDLAADALLGFGICDFLVEIGGELRGHGCKPDGMPWWGALENPAGAASLPQGVVALCGLSVATSGDAVHQRVTSAGVRLSHLLDPRTGLPASTGLASVTVFLPLCLDADAWATALFVAGPEQGPELAERQGLPALFTLRGDGGGAHRWTSPLEPMLG